MNIKNKPTMTNKQLYASVKASFVAKHTSLHKWCLARNIHRQNARDALLGVWNGEKANELCALLIKDAGIEVVHPSAAVDNQSGQPDSLVDH